MCQIIRTYLPRLGFNMCKRFGGFNSIIIKKLNLCSMLILRNDDQKGRWFSIFTRVLPTMHEKNIRRP